MKAVILAAGRGTRLEGASGGLPKCLLKVGGQSLIRRHLNVLDEIGIEKTLVVVGYGADMVMAEVGISGLLQFNAVYAETNSLYSLWLTRRWITGGVMVINADVLADAQIYRQLMGAAGNALAFDSRSGTEDEEMKVRFKSERLRQIDKKMRPEDSHGEHLGMLKFDADGAAALLDEADRMISAGRVNEWAPAAVDRVAKYIPVMGIDVSRLPWTEIDFPSDLRHAREKVWPTIHQRDVAAGGASLPVPKHHTEAFIARLAS